jgi:heme oxygenase
MQNSLYLKTHTSSHHDQIEGSIDLLKLSSEKNVYIKMLQAFASFYFSIELELSHFRKELGAKGVDLNERSKLEYLYSDLKYFGVSIDNFPRPQVKKINNVQEAMGILYVLEGSTLGGQIICTHLKKSGLIGEEGHGGSFFYSYGKHTIKKWQEFKTILDSLPAEDQPSLLSSAQWTFEFLQQWLSGCLVGKSEIED